MFAITILEEENGDVLALETTSLFQLLSGIRVGKFRDAKFLSSFLGG